MKKKLLSRRSMTLGVGSAISTLLVGPGVAREFWPGGARAAVSLTYDDGYDSQLENVVPLLNQMGMKASFFLTIENIDERLSDWQSVWRAGHEIANHTKSHPCRLEHFTADRFVREEIEPSQRYLDTYFGGPQPRCFAFPCGGEGLGVGATQTRVQRYQSALERRFLAARTVNGSPNNPASVLRQRYLLNAYEPTYDVDDARRAFAYLRLAQDHGLWAILVFHEVLPVRRSEGDTSKAVHRAILEHVREQAIWCAPMGTIFSHLAGA